MKNILIVFLGLSIGCLAHAGKIEDCYSSNQQIRDASYCADQEIGWYVKALEQRLEKLEKERPAICKIERIPGFSVSIATLYLGEKIVKEFHPSHYASWDDMIADANAAGKKLEKAGRCTFIK